MFFGNSYTYSGSFPNGFDYWSGWSYSNVINTTSAGFRNEYASFPGGGADGVGGVTAGGMYAIAYDCGAFFNLPNNTILNSVNLTNGTYAALSMRNGDSFAKKFGGTSGNESDFFRVELKGFDGLNGQGSQVGSVLVNLADFTFVDNSQDYILSNWLNVDLSSIGNAKSVLLDFTTSDVGAFGPNTPLYLAMDNLSITAVPEPSSTIMLSIAGMSWIARGRAKQKNEVN